ncbi:hypothetical protein T265_09831 [Opisthorchis viverrini]|uniref:Uncharacterized protein n=1 Tax=Opisthorchis viverrini TaxID=6198 RepID=A0A074Z4D9_OPIVI|nr:hypothetical protein T265_09831 [Opisthorchis viverrini]KER21961.1 hypothetical protein T265_09831 [Opisthorchis viverrini]
MFRRNAAFASLLDKSYTSTGEERPQKCMPIVLQHCAPQNKGCAVIEVTRNSGFNVSQGNTVSGLFTSSSQRNTQG